MSKKKAKRLYETAPTKENPKVIHIKIDMSDIKPRNLMHFEMQKKYRAKVVESKKNKPLKYKHKIYEEE